MFENVLNVTGAGDNVRGGVACPSWLFLLDRLEPGRVLCVGTPEAAERRWLADEATDLVVVPPSGLHRRAGGDSAIGPGPYDVVRVCDDATEVLVDDEALARLRTASAPEGQWWAAAVDRDATEPALRRAGIGPVRWVVPVTSLAALAASSPADGPLVRYLPPQPRRSRRSRLAAKVPQPAWRRRRATAEAAAPPAMVAGGAAAVEGPPRYLVDLAGNAGLDLSRCRWSLWARGDYPSQKAVVFLSDPDPAPDLGAAAGIVVKITKDARFNARLDNEHATLVRLAAAGDSVSTRAPHPLFSGRAGGLAVVGQRAVAGGPFLERSAMTVGCPIAADAADAITALGRATSAPVAAAALTGPLTEVLQRFVRLFAPPADAERFLGRQVDAIGAFGHLPGVLFHGDLGTWNLLVDDAGRVRILDWEAAETPGPPLWDLSYFLRSYTVQLSRRRLGVGRRLPALRRHFLTGSPLTRTAGEWMRRYGRAVDLDATLMAPLFHTCWMHRAVKEAARLPAGRRGHYAELCLLLAEHHDAPGLRTLLPGPTA